MKRSIQLNLSFNALRSLFRNPWIGTLILTIVGWFGNSFFFPLFFGVDFLFGSIFTMLILSLYGLPWGVFGAIVAGSFTYFQWGHPWAWLVLVLEALWVGIGLRRGCRNILLLDLAYWIPLGMAIVWVCYGQILHIPPMGTWVIVLKQALNGIFNTLVASLISSFLIYLFSSNRSNKTSLREIVFILLAVFTITPLLIVTIVTGRQNIQEIELQIESNLAQTGRTITQEIIAWYDHNQLALTSLGQSIKNLKPQASQEQEETLKSYLTTTEFILPGLSKLYVTDADGIILAIVPESRGFEDLVNSSVASTPLWREAREYRKTILSDVTPATDEPGFQVQMTTPMINNVQFEGVVSAVFSLSELDANLKKYIISSNIEAIVLDSQKKVIASNLQQEPSTLDNGTMVPRKDNLSHWLPNLPHKPTLVRWRNSFYVKEFPISDQMSWVLQVKISAAPYISRLEILYIRSLALLLSLLVIALPLVAFLSDRLTSPMLQLAQMSTDLPGKLRENTPLIWPNTEVKELALLTENFQGMVATIRSQFATIEAVNSGLEERVMERTLALQESEQRFRQFAEHIDSVFWMINFQDNAIIYVSPAYEKIWGKSRESLYDKPLRFLDSVLPSDRQRVLEALPHQLTGQYDEEYRIQRPTGEIRWIHDRAFPIFNDRGEPYRVVGIAEDVTERKETEQQMAEAKQAADAANQAKSEFLATMSHELRTPMNAVIGMTELLLDSPLNTQQQQFLRIIYNSGEALLSLITDILDFSRIEADRIELENAPFDLRSILEESLDLITAKATEKHLEVSYLMAKNCPEWIQGDANRIRQILVNLLGNAVKFTERGQVILQVGLAEDPKAPGSGNQEHKTSVNLQFSITDTGIGIPTHKLDRLFKPFSQVDASTTRMYGGTGLGLAICHRLVTGMGGNIGVDTQVGLGSRFHFTLPTVRITPLSNEENLNWVEHKRILIIDPSLTVGEMLRLQAESLGMEAVTTTTALQALSLVKSSSPFQVALMNWKSLGEIPQEWESEIEAIVDSQGYYLPIIYLADMGNSGCPKSLIEEGGHCYTCVTNCLAKPVKRSQLLTALVEVFRHPMPARSSLTRPSEKNSASDFALRLETTLAPELAFKRSTLVPRIMPPDKPLSELLSPAFAQHYPWRILLAEDNVVNQMVAVAMLQRLGYQVDVANNGIEVLALLRQHTYDVILMDLQMPELDGLATAQRIGQEFSPDQQPWMIAMTANVMQGVVETCHLAGLQDYVSKPVQLQTLATALSRVSR